MQPGHILILRDRKKGLPGAANDRLKCLSSMFSWAIQNRLMHFNPCRDVKKLRRKSEIGFHAWTIEECQQFVERWPRGSKAYLALALLFFCGDLVRLGPANVRGNTIAFVPDKTRHKSGKDFRSHRRKSRSPRTVTNFVSHLWGSPQICYRCVRVGQR
jgi:hypothetical protein